MDVQRTSGKLSNIYDSDSWKSVHEPHPSVFVSPWCYVQLDPRLQSYQENDSDGRPDDTVTKEFSGTFQMDLIHYLTFQIISNPSPSAECGLVLFCHDTFWITGAAYSIHWSGKTQPATAAQLVPELKDNIVAHAKLIWFVAANQGYLFFVFSWPYLKAEVRSCYPFTDVTGCIPTLFIFQKAPRNGKSQIAWHLLLQKLFSDNSNLKMFPLFRQDSTGIRIVVPR